MNQPINFNDPTGHMADQGDMGGGSDTVNCQRYPQYCNGDRPKSTDELLKMRNEKKRDKTDHELDGVLGLDKDSVLACSVNSCSIDLPPGVCPLGETCYIDSYDGSNLNPEDPDYLVINFSYKLVSASVIIDRHGIWYLSLGGTLDLVSIPYYSFSLRNGNIDGFNKQGPDVAQTQLFLTGWSYNAGAGLIVGASRTWSPGAREHAMPQFATEGGLYIPASLTLFSASYTVRGDDVLAAITSRFP